MKANLTRITTLLGVILIIIGGAIADSESIAPTIVTVSVGIFILIPSIISAYRLGID